jgi:nucleoside-triphosphatase THEP1
MQAKVYILTGGIQTGKTTALQAWGMGKTGIAGVLSPIIAGKRFFVDACTGERFAMEATEGDTAVWSVGRFVFRKAAFERAAAIIGSVRNKQLLVIDEVGPMELRQEGLHAAVYKALSQRTMPIILVVREGLVSKVMEAYAIPDAIVVNKEGLVGI